METLSLIVLNIQNYMATLDWSYIITFIIICYGINHYTVKESLVVVTGTRTRTRYRVVLIGILYGVVVYFLRGYSPEHIENLIQSFVFALVFHKLIVEAFVYWMAKHGLPETISKHLLDADQIEKLKQS